MTHRLIKVTTATAAATAFVAGGYAIGIRGGDHRHPERVRALAAPARDEARDARVAALAGVLQLDEAQLHIALQTLRHSRRDDAGARRTALAAALAASLGLDAATVRSALDDLAAQRGWHRRPGGP